MSLFHFKQKIHRLTDNNEEDEQEEEEVPLVHSVQKSSVDTTNQVQSENATGTQTYITMPSGI